MYFLYAEYLMVRAQYFIVRYRIDKACRCNTQRNAIIFVGFH